MKFNLRWRVTVALTTVLAVGAVTVPVTRAFHQKQQHLRNDSLRAAVSKSDSAAVLNALQSGADPNSRVFAGISGLSGGKGRVETQSVLQYAFERARSDDRAEQIVLHLLEFDARLPLSSNKEGPLSAACEHPRVLKKLVERGLSMCGGDADRALLVAAYFCPETMRILAKNGANINATDAGGATPLAGAITSFDPRLVRFMLDHGANVCQKASENLPAHFDFGRALFKARRSPLEIARRALDQERARGRQLARDPRSYQLQPSEDGPFRPIAATRETQVALFGICQMLRAVRKAQECGSAS